MVDKRLVPIDPNALDLSSIFNEAAKTAWSSISSSRPSKQPNGSLGDAEHDGFNEYSGNIVTRPLGRGSRVDDPRASSSNEGSRSIDAKESRSKNVGDGQFGGAEESRLLGDTRESRLSGGIREGRLLGDGRENRSNDARESQVGGEIKSTEAREAWSIDARGNRSNGVGDGRFSGEARESRFGAMENITRSEESGFNEMTSRPQGGVRVAEQSLKDGRNEEFGGPLRSRNGDNRVNGSMPPSSSFARPQGMELQPSLRNDQVKRNSDLGDGRSHLQRNVDGRLTDTASPQARHQMATEVSSSSPFAINAHLAKRSVFVGSQHHLSENVAVSKRNVDTEIYANNNSWDQDLRSHRNSHDMVDSSKFREENGELRRELTKAKIEAQTARDDSMRKARELIALQNSVDTLTKHMEQNRASETQSFLHSKKDVVLEIEALKAKLSRAERDRDALIFELQEAERRTKTERNDEAAIREELAARAAESERHAALAELQRGKSEAESSAARHQIEHWKSAARAAQDEVASYRSEVEALREELAWRVSVARQDQLSAAQQQQHNLAHNEDAKIANGLLQRQQRAAAQQKILSPLASSSTQQRYDNHQIAELEDRLSNILAQYRKTEDEMENFGPSSKRTLQERLQREQLRKKMDDLARQAAQVRSSLASMKSGSTSSSSSNNAPPANGAGSVISSSNNAAIGGEGRFR